MGSEVEFKSYEQQQGELLPAFVGDALDPTDSVFFVDDVVEDLDLESFERGRSCLLPSKTGPGASAIAPDVQRMESRDPLEVRVCSEHCELVANAENP